MPDYCAMVKSKETCHGETDKRRDPKKERFWRQIIGRQGKSGLSIRGFCLKRGDRVKLLYWSCDGYAIWYKRLEKGVFRFPEHCADGAEVAASTLTMLLEGVDLSSVKRPPRYVRKQ